MAPPIRTFALPGPQIGFLQEILRWWDYWLKGIDTGVMDEPMLRAWMTEAQNRRPTTTNCRAGGLQNLRGHRQA